MWSIGELKNTVEISETCAQDLFHAQAFPEELWHDVTEVTIENREGVRVLYFDSDHNEHMDFLHQERFTDVFSRHNARGEICFGSLDGDNAGSFWGYRFDGEGGMQKLTGSVEWAVSTT